jgi:hypothetical protein
MKKTTKGNSILQAIVSYVNRNSKEQDVPSGFYDKEFYYKKFGCTTKMFITLISKLKINDSVECIQLKRHHKGMMKKIAFYKIKPSVLKDLGIKL